MNPFDFAKHAAERLGPEVLAQGGRVLYSGLASLADGASAYYLGINPRDLPSSTEPDHHSVRTIGWDLALFAEGRTANAFLDESWAGMPPGSAELQRRVRRLAAWAGIIDEEAFRSMPASNVAFPRSEAQPSAAVFKAWADACWPVHELVLEATGATRILVGGTSAGELIVRSFGADPSRPDDRIRLRTANYSISVYVVKQKVVFVLPPLPRWKGMETVDAEATQALLARWIETPESRHD